LLLNNNTSEDGVDDRCSSVAALAASRTHGWDFQAKPTVNWVRKTMGQACGRATVPRAIKSLSALVPKNFCENKKINPTNNPATRSPTALA
jgi:hypothetical protein